MAPYKARMQAITRQLDALDAAEKQERDLVAERRADDATAVHARWVNADESPSRPMTSESFDLADVRIATLRDAESNDAQWANFVEKCTNASAYHDPRWLEVIRKVFGLETYLLVAHHGGAVVGGMPMVRQQSRIFGDFLTSLPFVNYGGPIGVSLAIEEELLRAAGELAESLGCLHVESRDIGSRSNWPARTDKLSMRLTLPTSAEALGNAIGSKLRAQIKRPEREGTTVRTGGAELIDGFYEVFARNMRDLGTPVLPKRWFQAIAAAFGDDSRIVLVLLDGRPVGAGWLHSFRGVVEIPWASTVREFNRLGINMQLYWHCLCWAIERGASVFDFGRSTIDAGTHRFKAQWGALPLALHWHYWLPPGAALPQLNPTNAKYRFLIAAWQRLPVTVSRLLGPAIIRHVP